MRWGVAVIAEVCEPTEQRDPRQNPAGEFHYVDIAGIDRTLKAIVEHQTLMGIDAPSRARKVIRKDDLLVSTVRPNLNAVAMVPACLDGQIASTGFCVLRPNRDCVEPRYLFYWAITSTFVDALTSRVRGANYPAVSDRDVKEVAIPLPPLMEQRRIVDILDRANRLRRLRADADAKVSRILPALFITMFGNPISNPMQWATRTLGEVTDHLTSGSRGWAKYTGRGEAFFVRTQDIQNGEISNQLVRLEPPTGAESERTQLAVGDVVVTITGIVGKAAVVRDTSRKLYVSQHVALVRPRQSVVLPEYIAAYANLPLGDIPVLARFQYGQTKPGLGFRELNTALIQIPPIDLQATFAERENFLQRHQIPTGMSHRALESLWNTVLNRAFSAELTASWRDVHMTELLQCMKQQPDPLAGVAQ